MAFYTSPVLQPMKKLSGICMPMKELGCNLVRIHIAGVDPRIYNLADKIGYAFMGRSSQPA